ncbi:MAG: excinuclease ABC subunit UvrA [Alphaproteobacteria bacterium]|nr:excinuclease ABC subunit UvrA [Alphaproteobacteria bacterium]
MPELGGPARSFSPRRRRKAAHNGDLVIRGATCHNLQGVDLTIPRASFAVITGVSGSGKTSLAFDTIFAEGQRRYVECMSTYARRFLGRLDRAPVESVEGLAPAIAINQKAASANPRSTVATVTEVYDYLRLLWARVGQPHCYKCGEPIRGWTPSAGARALQAGEPARGWLLAPLPPAEDPETTRKELLREGFLRLLLMEGQSPTELSLDSTGEARAAVHAALSRGARLVIDRVDTGTVTRQRLAEALRNAYAYGDGKAAFYQRDGLLQVFHERAECPTHGQVLPPELTPRHFSFNSYVGACPACEGTGRRTGVDPALLLPQPDQPLAAALDARVASVVNRSKKITGRLKSLARHIGLDLTTPVSGWTAEQRRAVLYGLPGEPITARWSKRWGKTRSSVTETFEWEGLIPTIEGWSSRLEWIRREGPCPTCEGGRLHRSILAVTLGGLSISGYCAQTVVDALAWADALTLDPADAHVAEQPLDEVRSRLRFLRDVGLGYLTLDRTASTLSGGEAQRIRLASQLGSGLTGCIYVLDEPTVGLHPRDTRRLLDTLLGLRDLGNTVVVVEHDPDTIRAADFVADMGPGAGEHGGQVVAVGSPSEISMDTASLTGAYLSGRRAMPRPEARRTPDEWLTLRGARANNLHGQDLRFPLGVFTAVTGVSGSGKSSLVIDALVPALKEHLGLDTDPAPVDGLLAPAGLKKLVVVDQSPIGLSPRSTPATYTKVMDALRDLYAKTTAAQVRGYDKGRFSFNSQGGRCPHCEGRGSILVEMHFLSDVWVTCEHCRGRRFNEATLAIRWQGLSIADALDLRIDDAVAQFRNQQRIARPLRRLADVGLGYLRLGQPATTLSGGEAQRVKLARELGGRGKGAIYVLDEPTTGLHFADVEKLIVVLQRLVDQGSTVIVIEHNTDLILNADHVIDMGPEGGSGGGRVVAQGTPEEVIAAGTATGRVLGELPLLAG